LRLSVSEIHPTAVIHPSAEIGSGCHVGPFCVIHAGVRLGDDCWLQDHVSLAGPSEIGPRNRFFAFSSIGQQSQDMKYAGEPTHLAIGHDNTFREFCTVNRGTAPGGFTRVGNHGTFLAYSHVAHDCVVGDSVIFSNNGTIAGHVTVEDNVVIGGLTAVHQFCRIGCHVITGGCSKIVQDIPPYLIADGNPAAIRGLNQVGLERQGFSANDLRLLKEAYKILFLRKLPQIDALAAIRALTPSSESLAHFANFVEASPRGIVRTGRGAR